jgi:hypothetical protein
VHIKLQLTVDQTNLVMAALGKLPFEAVADTIMEIRTQAMPQVQPKPEAEPEAKAEVKPKAKDKAA